MGIKALSFHIDPLTDIEDVWQILEEAGCDLLYSDASDHFSRIYGNIPSHLTKEIFLAFPGILAIEAIELPEIDWEAQWAAQEGYSDGFLHVDLNAYAEQKSILKLIPGAGFGDHSHPTTRLVLQLMPSFIFGKDVIDVGCGSGILSLAAVSMGAKSVCGIDIDEDALIHSRANSKCNGMEGISFIFPEELEIVNDGSIILMNMIQSEQEVAWKSLEAISDKVSIVITSGILSEGRDAYLKMVQKWGWSLLKEKEEDGWLGFVLKNSTQRHEGAKAQRKNRIKRII